MRICWSCKSFIYCLNAGQLAANDGAALSCEFYEREYQLPKEEIKIIGGIVYRRIIDDNDGEL